MKAMIIVESWFGNTRTIADEVADGLRSHLSVEVHDVGSAPRAVPDDVTLVILAGPTHAFGLSRAGTRSDAVKRGGSGQAGIGLRDWLDATTVFEGSPWVTAFDTRIAKPLLPGSAARAAVRRLRKAGGRLLLPPASFFVEDVDGPLRDGERQRAQRWARDVVAALARHGLLPTGGGQID